MRIRVGHLYPEYLNIYADRGNIAVLRGGPRCAVTSSRCGRSSLGDALDPGAHDLLYVGGGQDREQGLIAPDLAAKGEALRAAHSRGVALLAVCGGYQLLGRGYRGRDGSFMPGAGLFGHETVAGDVRMIGDVLLDCELEPGTQAAGRGLREPRRADGSRRRRGAARPGRARFRKRRAVGLRGLPARARARDVSARAAAAAQPVACRLAARAGARARDRRRGRSRCRRSPTSSRTLRSAWQPSAHASAAVGANCGILEGHPGPPPTAIVTRKSLRMGNGTAPKA